METTIESALIQSAKVAGIGIVVSSVGLLIPTDQLLLVFILQLSLLVGISIWLTFRLRACSSVMWFSVGPIRWQRWATAAALVSFVTGAIALITLASSGALRLAPSLQFLQLLSALDIAWAVSALFIGLRWKFGTRVAVAGATVLGVLCIYSIWNYLTIFGFGPDGAWLLNGAGLVKYVLPGDIAAAVLALSVLTWGAGQAD